MRNTYRTINPASHTENRRKVIANDRAGKPNPYREGYYHVKLGQGYPREYDTWTEWQQIAYERGKLAAASAIGLGEALPAWRHATYPAAIGKIFETHRDGMPKGGTDHA